MPTITTRTTEKVPRNREVTSAKILSAAYKEFAAHGLTGAKVERIARRARVNKRLVYYYFESREGLYAAVLQHAYTLVHSTDGEIDLEHLDPLVALEMFIDRTLERVFALPEVNSLIADENHHQARHIRDTPWIQALHKRVLGQIDAMLRNGRDAGLFRADVDPVHLFMSVLGMSLIYLNNMHTLSVVLSRDLDAPEERARWKKHIFDLCLSGIAPDPRTQRDRDTADY